MHCPYCECENTKVVDSRESGASIRRRRECALCGRRFTTYEQVQMKAMMVVKRDGRREEFSRGKLWSSLTKACAKRPLAIARIDRMIDDIETNLSEQGKAEFDSRAIGEMVMSRLSDLDQVAYIRFASVYLDFSDVPTSTSWRCWAARSMLSQIPQRSRSSRCSPSLRLDAAIRLRFGRFTVVRQTPPL